MGQQFGNFNFYKYLQMIIMIKKMWETLETCFSTSSVDFNS